MQYVNCLYTTQGEYVCQKNEKLDAFYNKPVVEGFYAGDAAKDEAQKVALQIRECTVPDMKSEDAKKKAVAMKTCAGAMTNAYHNYCNTNQATRCFYTAPPAQRGKTFVTCDSGLKSQIDNAINSVVSGTQTDATKLFTCPAPPK